MNADVEAVLAVIRAKIDRTAMLLAESHNLRVVNVAAARHDPLAEVKALGLHHRELSELHRGVADLADRAVRIVEEYEASETP